MIISGSSSTPCNNNYTNASQEGVQMYSMTDQDHHNLASSSSSLAGGTETNSAASLFYNLSILKEKVHQVQSLVSILLSQEQCHPESASIAMASMSNVIQELIITASSMMFTCQQMSLGSFPGAQTNTKDHQLLHDQQQQQLEWFGGGNYTSPTTACNNMKESNRIFSQGSSDAIKKVEEGKAIPQHHQVGGKKYLIIELDAADLLAKYTHYCQVCGKGFKRDANLRMHMRAHGDEYKTSAALSNPMKNMINSSNDDDSKGEVVDGFGVKPLPSKYSCPQEGCRWNQRHAKFQPLKSIICVKNHYKRSHCPKMYVCKRCNRKQFSVLSDLRTHEKHCGILKWQCSCGTTFSRKDKLMGHVALFTGHSPIPNNSFTALHAAVKVDNTNHSPSSSLNIHAIT